MPYLDPDTVLALAGYQQTGDPAAWTTEQLAAVSFAEAAIESHTGAVWYNPAVSSGEPATPGEPSTATLRVRLSAYAYLVPLPRDVLSVDSVYPAQESGYTLVRTDHGVELWDDDAKNQEDLVRQWAPGSYLLTVSRGFIPDEAVERAGALLAAYYLRLPDPERSVYGSFSEGDFSGSFRFGRLPVPEAEPLLRPFAAERTRASV